MTCTQSKHYTASELQSGILKKFMKFLTITQLYNILIIKKKKKKYNILKVEFELNSWGPTPPWHNIYLLIYLFSDIQHKLWFLINRLHKRQSLLLSWKKVDGWNCIRKINFKIVITFHPKILKWMMNNTLTFKSTQVRCFALSKAWNLTSRHLQPTKENSQPYANVPNYSSR